MLLQSHAGVLRFFPVWDAAALGPASFQTLRAYGAFLVSASVNTAGVVAPIQLFSEQGHSPCVIESPWPTLVVTAFGGKALAVTKSAVGTFEFNTTKGASYALSDK
jgi:hypothetical protein